MFRKLRAIKNRINGAVQPPLDFNRFQYTFIPNEKQWLKMPLLFHKLSCQKFKHNALQGQKLQV